MESLDQVAIPRVQEAVRADTVESRERHVLQEAPQEFVAAERHHLAPATLARSIGERHRPCVAGGDSLVGQGGAVEVAGEIVEGRPAPSRARTSVVESTTGSRRGFLTWSKSKRASSRLRLCRKRNQMLWRLKAKVLGATVRTSRKCRK